MCTLFDSALENGLVTSNLVSKAVKCKFKETKGRRIFKIDEQKRFVEYAKGTLHYDAFCFILQTGVRVGEMMG